MIMWGGDAMLERSNIPGWRWLIALLAALLLAQQLPTRHRWPRTEQDRRHIGRRPVQSLQTLWHPARRHHVRGNWQPPTYDGDSQINSYAVTPFQGTTALTPVTGSNEPAHGHGPKRRHDLHVQRRGDQRPKALVRRRPR